MDHNHLQARSHLRFIRHEVLRKLFSSHNREKCLHKSLLNFSDDAKVDQIPSVNAPV